MTVADLIAELQKHPQDALVLAQFHLSYFPAAVVKIASTEYGLFPGHKKVAIVAMRGE